MSIVNISSENRIKGSGTDADYRVKLKKPLMRVIGMQILNITIPLTYDIINEDDDEFTVEIDAAGTPKVTSKIPWGTYSGDELAQALTVGFQKAEHSTDYHLMVTSNEQRKLHFKTGLHEIPVVLNQTVNEKGIQENISFENVKVGMVIGSKKIARIVSIETIEIIDASGVLPDGENYVLTTEVKLKYQTTDGVTNTIGSNSKKIENVKMIVHYDEIKNVFVIARKPFSATVTEMVSISSSNSERMLKTLGFKLDDESTSTNPSAGKDITDSVYTGKEWVGLGEQLVSTLAPELTGPSTIFLRLSGDILLDQQNTETSNNDRIPIPIDQDHGGIVHFESDDKTDVIPFSIPCDVTTVGCRFEYGDDNTTIGGRTNNLRGHHTYIRAKFYFAQQGGGIGKGKQATTA